jgi:hypothetical protein
MKAQEIKYLYLLQALATQPGASHKQLSEALDMSPALVNRYLRRLAGWGAVRAKGERSGSYRVAPDGRIQLARGAWAFLAFAAPLYEACRDRAVSELRDRAEQRGWSRAALYGRAPLAGPMAEFARAAGLDVVAVCDEERAGGDKLDDLEPGRCDCIILADWDRAEDAVLLRLLAEYAPVVNLFVVDGKAVPEWS